MSIKSKVAFGVAFLFVLILTLGGLGIFYLNSASKSSQHIIADNYESMEYSRRILQASDSLTIDSSTAMLSISQNLIAQERNITEQKEKEITAQLRIAFEKLKDNTQREEMVTEIRAMALELQAINLTAMACKSALSEETSSEASLYLIVIGTLCALAAFVFVVNFPGYIANPVARLSAGIKAIAQKNYEERLHFDRKDEFEELAEAFNQMAEKLDEYEHSSLAKIILEKKRTETIINRMSDPVIGLDESNMIIFANENAISLLNLERPAIIGRYAPDVAVNNDLFRNLLKDNHDPDDHHALIKAVISGKENYFTKEQLPVSYVPTGEKEEISVGKVLLLRNVTSYKELDLAKTNFIATISHELKTPIASIQMCIKLMQDRRVGELNSEQSSIVTTLHDEATRLSRITNELLDLSQLESGNIKLNIDAVNPNEIVTMALDAVGFHAEQRHVRINVQQAAGEISVVADKDKTTWVLINFLMNAIRFTKEHDNVEINVVRDGASVMFNVSDHGPGIEAQYVDRIFEKYFQVPGSGQGTGLGLAISKEFIEAQGGTIGLTSSRGKGSLFYFSLPIA